MRLIMIATQKWLILIGAILWPSFLFAGVATMLFFSAFDPFDLQQVATFPYSLSRTASYSIGFFGFWALGAACSFITTILLGIIKLREVE